MFASGRREWSRAGRHRRRRRLPIIGMHARSRRRLCSRNHRQGRRTSSNGPPPAITTSVAIKELARNLCRDKQEVVLKTNKHTHIHELGPLLVQKERLGGARHTNTQTHDRSSGSCLVGGIWAWTGWRAEEVNGNESEKGEGEKGSA